jgi:hypothetical protein
VFATHTKPLQIGGSTLIGPLGGGGTIVVLQSAPYSTNTGKPVAIPLKLFFTRFPPIIEAFVQRIQNYFSTYNHVDNENYPVSTQENKPLLTTTMSTSVTTAVNTPTVTTLEPSSTDAGSQTANDLHDEHTTSIPSFGAPEDT